MNHFRHSFLIFLYLFEGFAHKISGSPTPSFNHESSYMSLQRDYEKAGMQADFRLAEGAPILPKNNNHFTLSVQPEKSNGEPSSLRIKSPFIPNGNQFQDNHRLTSEMTMVLNELYPVFREHTFNFRRFLTCVLVSRNYPGYCQALMQAEDESNNLVKLEANSGRLTDDSISNTSPPGNPTIPLSGLNRHLKDSENQYLLAAKQVQSYVYRFENNLHGLLRKIQDFRFATKPIRRGNTSLGTTTVLLSDRSPIRMNWLLDPKGELCQSESLNKSFFSLVQHITLYQSTILKKHGGDGEFQPQNERLLDWLLNEIIFHPITGFPLFGEITAPKPMITTESVGFVNLRFLLGFFLVEARTEDDFMRMSVLLIHTWYHYNNSVLWNKIFKNEEGFHAVLKEVIEKLKI